MDDSNVLQGTLPVQVTDDSGLVRPIQPDAAEVRYCNLGLSLDCKATPTFHGSRVGANEAIPRLLHTRSTVHDPRLGCCVPRLITNIEVTYQRFHHSSIRRMENGIRHCHIFFGSFRDEPSLPISARHDP